MSDERWFFTTSPDGVIHLRARVDQDDITGHAYETVDPGGDFRGISHEELFEKENGVVEVDEDGDASILDDDEAKVDLSWLDDEDDDEDED